MEDRAFSKRNRKFNLIDILIILSIAGSISFRFFPGLNIVFELLILLTSALIFLYLFISKRNILINF